MPGKRCGENEDQPKVERPWGRPPGSKTRLSSGSSGRRCGLGRGLGRLGRGGGGGYPAPGPDTY